MTKVAPGCPGAPFEPSAHVRGTARDMASPSADRSEREATHLHSLTRRLAPSCCLAIAERPTANHQESHRVQKIRGIFFAANAANLQVGPGFEIIGCRLY